ncbi:MAG TPA: hypothetical protein PLO69_11200 [Gammaproteobacteria bacterium]|nr:hypothetical protein [Gammaproteobacteria bacterium]
MIDLDDADRALLRSCPRTLDTDKRRKQTRDDLARMKRVKRLWAAGLIGGEVVHGGLQLSIRLQPLGRQALGLSPVAEGTRP